MDPSGPRGTPSDASIATVFLPTPASAAPAPPPPLAAILVGSSGPARCATCRGLLRPSAVVVVVPVVARFRVPPTQTCALQAPCLNVMAGCAGTKQAAGSAKRRATTLTRDAVVFAILPLWSRSSGGSSTAVVDTRYDHAPLLFVDQMTPKQVQNQNPHAPLALKPGDVTVTVSLFQLHVSFSPCFHPFPRRFGLVWGLGTFCSSED